MGDFYVSEETRGFFKAHKAELKTKYDAWQSTLAAWKEANPEKAKLLQDGIDMKMPTVEEMFAAIPEQEPGSSLATRVTGAHAMQGVAKACPLYTSGSADLHGSIMNGIAYFGLFRTSGATFLVFADYLRAPVRVAALSELPVGYILTHDSVGVGEDGPTHQPVETVSGLRVMPNLDVIRPCDAEEAAGAMAASIERLAGPTALILTRQNVPDMNAVSATERRYGVLKGAYIMKKETAALDLILIATGSEVQHAVKAAEELGAGVRVVSMPCMERFDRQPEAYKAEVLPAGVKKIAMEAGVSGLWYKYADKVVGVDRFGISAPGDTVMQKFGMTAENLVKEAKAR